MKLTINANSKLEAKFSIYSHFNKILVYQLGKDGVDAKKYVLSNYSFNRYIDPKKDFSDSKFEHQILRLATQILLYEILWEKVNFLMYYGPYSKKHLKKIVEFFKRGASLK